MTTSFISKLENQLNDEKQLTENGAVGYKTSGKKLVDFNFAVSSMRNWDETKIINLFIKVYYENPLLAIKYLFYLRDIRGNGMGEREVFKICIKWLVENHFEKASKIVKYIPEFGRYDDWMCLLDTKARSIVIEEIRKQLEKDVYDMQCKKQISLIAKWLPSINSKSLKTKAQAKIIVKGLNMKESQYRKLLSSLRAYLQVVEVKMSANKWKEINYSEVPSRANLIYEIAFLKRDEDRRQEFLNSLSNGETTINASTLFPSDIVYKYTAINMHYNDDHHFLEKNVTLESLWQSLPNYVQDDTSTLVVRDGSGSMNIQIGKTSLSALNVSTALTIYFSERCSGQFHNKFITFSRRPQIVDLSNANCLRDKLEICFTYHDYTNTDLAAVFDLILNTAIKNKLKQKDLPKNILIISDMEFDCIIPYRYDMLSFSSDTVKTLMESIAEKYKMHGFTMPRLVFWNICSRTNTIPLKENEAGIVLVSGFNPTVYNMVLSNELDPYKCLLNQINCKRYDVIEKAL